MDNEICLICQDIIINEYVILNCNCKYYYHSKCIKYYLTHNNNCPVCKHKYMGKPKKSQTNILNNLKSSISLESPSDIIRLYATNYNILRIMSGMGSIGYST